jgi:ribonuclease P/MRP protein subunit RPP40
MKLPVQYAKAAKTAVGVLAQISRAFMYQGRKIWMGLYKTYVQPHLEFAVQAWSMWSHSDIDCLKRTQEKL